MQKRETQQFERLYAQFLNTLKLQGYSQSTIEAYTYDLRRQLKGADPFNWCH